MPAMSQDEIRAFLAAGTRTGKLATTRADGRPHVAPIWFVLDGDTLVLTTGEDTVKGRNLLRDARVMLAVDDQTPPFSFALVEGTAEISRDPDDLLRWAIRIAARYMGEDQAEAYGKRSAVPSGMLVRIRPTRMTGERDIAS